MFREVYLNYINNKKEIKKQNESLKELEYSIKNLVANKEKLTREMETLEVDKVTLQEDIKRIYLEKTDLILESNDNRKIKEELEEEIEINRASNQKLIKDIKLNNQIIQEQLNAKNTLLEFNVQFQEVEEIITKKMDTNKPLVENRIPEFFKDINKYLVSKNIRGKISAFTKNYYGDLREIMKYSPFHKNYVFDESIIDTNNWDVKITFNFTVLDRKKSLLNNLYQILREDEKEVTKVQFAEYLKYEYIIQTHEKILVELNLLKVYSYGNDLFLEKIFALYGEKTFYQPLNLFLSYELLKRNIYWNYKTLEELSNLIKLSYYKYQKKLLAESLTQSNSEQQLPNQINVTKDEINQFTGEEFEKFLQLIFLRLGYDVSSTPMTNDQGADLLINDGTSSIAVQAKRYTGTVGNNAVQQVLASKVYYKCDEALVVTSSEFTKSAIDLAKKSDVLLWTGTY